MSIITVKVRNGKALVTDNPTKHKVVNINYDDLHKHSDIEECINNENGRS